MSEVDLKSLADVGQAQLEIKAPTTPMQEINVALKECKFGIFHYRLLVSSFIGMNSLVFVTGNSSYLLPFAECDLQMNLVQKGILNAVPYFGMLLTSIAAGLMTDIFGRKIFLQVGYGGLFLFTLVSAFSQSYRVLVTAKFFEGVFFATAFNPHVILTSEFCHNGIRDRVMLTQSSFVAIAHIVSALLSWLILTTNWKYTVAEGFVLNTWNIYLLSCSLWTLTALLLYTWLPESPKYLLSQKKYDEARAVLIQIYRENTGKPADTYPCASFWRNKAQQEQQTIDEAAEYQQKKGLRNQLAEGLHNVKPAFQKPLVFYLMLISSMIFLSMCMYNIIRLWFPQLATIIEHSKMGNSNETVYLCDMFDEYTNELKSKVTKAGVDGVCVPTISGLETYISSMIMGSVCVIPYLVSGILVNKVGKKPLLMFSALTSSVFMLALKWTYTKTAVVAFFSIDTALSQIITGLLQTSVVEFFPTTTRTLAISIMMMAGRVGTLIGQVAFPALLNMRCVIPFFTMAGIMACVTVMSVFLPSKKK